MLFLYFTGMLCYFCILLACCVIFVFYWYVVLFLYFTGMLLELEIGRLRQLLEDKQLLKQCIDKAYVALSGMS